MIGCGVQLRTVLCVAADLSLSTQPAMRKATDVPSQNPQHTQTYSWNVAGNHAHCTSLSLERVIALGATSRTHQPMV